MNVAVNPDLNLKTFCNSKSYIRLRERDISSVGLKFYQKLFVVLVSMSTMLIFPESPREIENICVNYNSIKLCNIW